MPKQAKMARLSAVPAVAIAVAVAVLVGCSSSTIIAERKADAPAMLIQCLVLYNLAPHSSLGISPVSPTRPSWLTGTGVEISPSNAASFSEWYSRHASDVVAGKSLAAWQEWSAQHDKLPSELCGTAGSHPSSLHKEVYLHDPGTASPW